MVDPSTGNYIVFNMGTLPSEVPDQPGFPGTTNVGTVEAAAVQADRNAGQSYRFNAGPDHYEYSVVSVACFVTGSLIHKVNGLFPVEELRIGNPGFAP